MESSANTGWLCLSSEGVFSEVVALHGSASGPRRTDSWTCTCARRARAWQYDFHSAIGIL